MGYLFRTDSVNEETKPPPSTNDKQAKRENNAPPDAVPRMERNDSSDFWSMLGSSTSKSETKEKTKPQSAASPAAKTSANKPDSQPTRQSASEVSSPRRGTTNKPSPQTSTITNESRSNSAISNNTGTDAERRREQRIEERIRFVRESYEHDQREQAERTKFKDELEAKLDEWEFNSGVRRNIRSLLTKLPEVLWEDSGWKPVGLGDLVQSTKCKKSYQLALRLVHPDRAANRGDDARTKVICERVFL